MYESLPKNEKTFSIDIVGTSTAVRYVGDFTVKCILSVADTHLFELERTRLMSDYANPTDYLFALATRLAILRVRIVHAPRWWDELDRGSKVLDGEVLIKLYEECIKAENAWKDDLKKKSEAAAAEQDSGNAVREG